MDIFKVIKTRRTIRKYQEKIIPKIVLDKIIEAGIWAPSAHNSQPWNFKIIAEEKWKDIFCEKLNQYPSSSILSSVNISIKRTIAIMQNAPVIIAVYNNGKLSRDSSKLGKIYYSAAYISEIESIAAAIENMHLVATALGVGMAWLTMPLLIKDYITSILKVEGELMAILTFGYPAEKGKIYLRKSVSSIV